MSLNRSLPGRQCSGRSCYPEDSHRLGTEHRNCEEIAQLAEDCGIQALPFMAVHAPVCSMEKLSTTVLGS